MPDMVTCVDIDGNEHRVAVTSLRWRPSAYGIIIKDDCLLVSPQFGGYDLPGGGIELGETVRDALIREIKEETGIDASAPHLITCQESFFVLSGSEKGEHVQSLLFYFACDFAGGVLSTDGFTEDEKLNSRAPEWLPLDQLDTIELASSVDWRPYVKQVLDHAHHRH